MSTKAQQKAEGYMKSELGFTVVLLSPADRGSLPFLVIKINPVQLNHDTLLNVHTKPDREAISGNYRARSDFFEGEIEAEAAAKVSALEAVRAHAPAAVSIAVAASLLWLLLVTKRLSKKVEEISHLKLIKDLLDGQLTLQCKVLHGLQMDFNSISERICSWMSSTGLFGVGFLGSLGSLDKCNPNVVSRVMGSSKYPGGFTLSTVKAYFVEDAKLWAHLGASKTS
ncbi:hypothetical protein BKA93DRAFT_752477 [Sparassis latifolia]